MAFGINIPVGFKLNNAGLHKAQKEFHGFGKSIKGALGVAGIAVGPAAFGLPQRSRAAAWSALASSLPTRSPGMRAQEKE